MAPDTPQYLLAFWSTVVAAACVPFVHIPVMRIVRDPGKVLLWMLVAFATSVAVWFGVFMWLNGGRPPLLVEAVSGMATLGFLFLGYMEMMFKIYRGFSHTLVADVYRSGGMSWEDIVSNFAEGIGMEEMFRRRIATMEEGNIVVVEGTSLRLTPRGKFFGAGGLLFKKFLKLGAGG